MYRAARSDAGTESTRGIQWAPAQRQSTSAPARYDARCNRSKRSPYAKKSRRDASPNGGVGVRITASKTRSRNLSGSQTCDGGPLPLGVKHGAPDRQPATLPADLLVLAEHVDMTSSHRHIGVTCRQERHARPDVRLTVVDQVDSTGDAAPEAEAHPPRSRNREAPVPLRSPLSRRSRQPGQSEAEPPPAASVPAKARAGRPAAALLRWRVLDLRPPLTHCRRTGRGGGQHRRRTCRSWSSA